MPHNENSRVKIPALVHFTRLGYKYISLRKYEGVIDDETNILVDVLCDAINRINATSLTTTDVQKIVNALKAMLENDDLGREFYSVLINGYNGLKLIDFEDFEGTVNSYHVVTEMTCKNGSDEFRPDITPLINGLPLAFIEVKKPNNKGGIKAEYDRMLMRVKNKKFRRFINLTQIMAFSNNSEYDDTEAVPLEGAFYSTISYEKLFFSHFREEDEKLLTSVPEKDEAVENFILTDNNLSSIKYSPEYVTNSSPVSPTNRIITSLFSFERILTFLKYAIAYVERTDENGITHLEKHLMRYPQFFATKAIENKLNAGVKNGIIWHTQGSGKTALAYYNVRYLTDYYQKHGTIAKFYFIVDRLDLLTQAANEFRARGLHVEEINSKEDFIKNIHSTGTVNNTGKPTITVVNIQKFSKESIAKQSDYAVNVQRIYFLDEAHRSYKPTGSFLANLLSSDREAVMIALTGTPLIGTIYDDDGKPIAGKKYDSKSVFGNYIHKYYYNRSIADGLFNVAKLFGYDELADQFDLNNISALYSEVCNRIALINQKKLLEEAQDMSAILNLAMDEIEFHFRKVSEKELVIADKYQDTLNRTRKAVLHTLDPKDPEYITLLEELQRLLAKKNIEELTADEMTADIEALERIRKLAEQKNLADQMLAAKYDGDVKFMRTHKRLRETPPPIAGDVVLHQVLTHLKHRVDSQVLSNSHLMDNEPYFMQGMFPMIKQELDAQHLKYSAAQIKYIGTCISNEYFTERNFAS